MADAYEPYHVPQQSRRDKLRILSHAQQNPSLDSHFQFHPSACSGLFPLVDADLLTCAAGGGFHANTHLPNSDPDPDPGCAVKPGEPGHLLGTFMGFFGGVSVNGSPSSSTAAAAANVGDRAYGQSFSGGHGGEVLVFKPEPLSLSLSSHQAQQNNNFHRFGCELLIPGVVDGSRCGGGSVASRSSVPLGPFTGYASILKGSRFLKPAHQLLEEFCNAGLGIYAERIDDDDDDSSLLFDSSSMENLAASFGVTDDGGGGGCGGGGESRKKKSKLLSMLDEVYKRYKQYYQQLQTVVTSFECVAGLGNAAPYASLALKALSKHFKCLKNALTDQLQFTNKTQDQQAHHHNVVTSEKVEPLRFGNNDRRGFYAGQRPGFSDHHPPVWRPQRGLPERAVAVLRAWLFDHFLHPYPTDTDKLMLAKQTGLSRNQVSNWFINARVRVWKPMVEEIHMLETRQAQKTSSRRDDRSVINRANGNFPENPSSSASKRTRNDGVPETFPAGGNEALNFSYGGVGLSGIPGLCTSGVSLTLGLHQNNCMGLPEQLPINGVQGFELGGGGGEGYVGIGGGFEGQNREFGRVVIGNSNQFLHDFVG